jgi:hypothetical protein
MALISPESTGYWPKIASASSVRPDPNRPVIPRISPGAIEKEMFEKVGLVLRFLTSITFEVDFLSGGAIRVSEIFKPVIASEIASRL